MSDKINPKLINLKIGDLFSFSKKGAIHMVVRNSHNTVEYKSYNDGKIRVANREQTNKIVHDMSKFDKVYEAKWFAPILEQNHGLSFLMHPSLNKK